MAVSGDFDGEGHWHLRADGDHIELLHVWKVLVNKPIVRILSPLLRPLFAWNHHWTMRRGEEALNRELARRRREASLGYSASSIAAIR